MNGICFSVIGWTGLALIAGFIHRVGRSLTSTNKTQSNARVMSTYLLLSHLWGESCMNTFPGCNFHRNTSTTAMFVGVAYLLAMAIHLHFRDGERHG